jgi:Family of unknown function (DUF6283)
MSEIRSQPCLACPYRQDVPSGVWAHEEYEKLRDYDEPTHAQPISTFACHATPEHLCHGWAVVHTSRGHEYDLLALRFWPSGPIPKAAVPLFASGNEAADHGQKDIETPSAAATETVDRLVRKYPRFRTTEGD